MVFGGMKVNLHGTSQELIETAYFMVERPSGHAINACMRPSIRCIIVATVHAKGRAHMAEVASTPDSTGSVLRQDILLTTKLHAPLVRPDLVARPRLVELVDRGLSSRLRPHLRTAGSGKTTLLAEWIASENHPLPGCGWARATIDPARFWAYASWPSSFSHTSSASTKTSTLLGNLTKKKMKQKIRRLVPST